MDGDSADLALNITGSDSFPKRPKKKGRFYGKNNFRHKNAAKRRSRNQRMRVKKINTAKVDILNIQDQKTLKETDVEGSTALHFKGVEVIPVNKPLKQSWSNKRLKKDIKQKNTDPQNKLGSEKPANLGENAKVKPNGQKISWRSSLFNQNPEIPKVRQPEVAKVQEVVFCGKLFSDLNIHSHLLSFINEKLGLKNMTSIQQKSIPVLLEGKDALIKSQTGSGKTLAYAVPVVQKVQELEPMITRKDGPIVLILVPTRELALQSYNIFSKLTLPFCRIVPSWIIGGENRKSEKSRIRRGVNILIGTPGRILDHIQTTQSLKLNNIRWIVFDEADRLLDMGFQKQVDGILEAARMQGTQSRQTVLLSATLSDKVERLACLAMKDPVRVQLSTLNDSVDSSYESDDREDNFAIPTQLTQHVAIVPSKLRLIALVMFLKGKLTLKSSCKIMVFLSCRDSVEFHYHLLKHILRRAQSLPDFSIPLDVDLDDGETEEVNVSRLHGGMAQAERQEVFNTFISADSGALLSTDVAARGLDLPCVDWVVQYTSPGSPVDYIHKAGRTARAGKEGNALLMLTPAEAKYITLLTQFNIQVEEMTVDDILVSTSGFPVRKRRNNERLVETAKSDASSLQNQMESYIAKNKKIQTLAKTAYASFIRSYATYPTELKSIFHVKHLHLGHVAKSFGLMEAPSDIVKTLQKSVGQLPVRSSFEHREAKKKAAADAGEEGQPEVQSTEEKEHLSRRQKLKLKMTPKLDLMSEFSSGLETTTPKKVKKFC